MISPEKIAEMLAAIPKHADGAVRNTWVARIRAPDIAAILTELQHLRAGSGPAVSEVVEAMRELSGRYPLDPALSRLEVAVDALAELQHRGAAEAGDHVADAGKMVDPGLSELLTLRTERDKLHAAMTKISAIRDSIIGFQNVGWSEHIYPLVAALHEGGFDGIGYDEARKHVQATLDATKAMKARAIAAEAKLARQGEVLKHYANPDNWSDGRWPQDDSDDETNLVHRCIPVTWQQEEGGAVPVADCGNLARSTLSPEDSHG